MSVVVDTESPEIMTVSPGDARRVADLARTIACSQSGLVDDPVWISAARRGWEDLPPALRGTIRRFRRYSGPHGALLLRGLPVDEAALPPTPSVAGSIQRPATTPATILMLTACGLGDPAAFKAEMSGALVQNVVPVPGSEEFQGNAGSALLAFHSENAFHAHRPDFVLLLCLRPDHAGLAGLRCACIRMVLPLLTGPARDALASPEFITAAPPSFGRTATGTSAHAVLTGAPDDPDIRVDLAATRALSPRAASALAELAELLDRTAQTICLRPGDLAIIDNRVAVHGRTYFEPRYDGRDRWLQRTFACADIRRSRAGRPGDGYVMA